MAFDLLQESFSTDYAPAKLKQQTYGWDLRTELKLLRTALNESRTDEDKRQAYLGFFGSLKDIHSKPIFLLQKAVWAGFHVKKIGDQYLVVWIDPKSEAAKFLTLGDEITSFAGKPISIAVKSIKDESKWFSTPAFEQSFAEWFLTYRATSDFQEIPKAQDRLPLEIIDSKTKASRLVNLTWVDDAKSPPSERCPYWGKSKGGYLPSLGPIVWSSKANSIYNAYGFRHGKEIYGYIRFHTYDLSASERLQALAELTHTISRFKRLNVQKLVIDQTGNAGGNFVFGFALLSKLTGVRLRTPLQRYILNNEKLVGFGDIRKIEKDLIQFERVRTESEAFKLLTSHPLFVENLNFVKKDLSTVQRFRDFLRFFVADSKRNPARHLTEPWYQFQEYIDPDESVHFDGSIVVLIDELNLSAAEFIAATLKDNHRAKLIGTTTAGAGGDQRAIRGDDLCKPSDLVYQFNRCTSSSESHALESEGLRGFTYTITVGERISASGEFLGPIENVGVAPDIQYSFTERDIRFGFADFRRLILKAL